MSKNNHVTLTGNLGADPKHIRSGADERRAAAAIKHADRALKSHLELSRSGTAEEAGLIQLNNGIAESRTKDTQEKKKQREHSFMEMIRQYQGHMNDMINEMNELADRLLEIAEEQQQKIITETERMQENSRFMSEAERFIQDHKDGKPVDKAPMIASLKKRDLNITDETRIVVLIETILPQEISKANEQNSKLDERITQRQDKVVHLKQDAQDIKTQVSNLKQDFDQLNAQSLSEEEYQQAAETLIKKYNDEVIDKYRRSNSEFALEVDDIRQKERIKEEPINEIAAKNNSGFGAMFGNKVTESITTSVATSDTPKMG